MARSALSYLHFVTGWRNFQSGVAHPCRGVRISYRLPPATLGSNARGIKNFLNNYDFILYPDDYRLAFSRRSATHKNGVWAGGRVAAPSRALALSRSAAARPPAQPMAP